MPEKAPSHLLVGEQNQRLFTEQARKSRRATAISLLATIKQCLFASHGMIASVRPLCQAMLKVVAGRDGWSDNMKELTDMTIMELLRDTANKLAWRMLSIASTLRAS